MEQFTVICVGSILNLVILIKIGCIKLSSVCLSSRTNDAAIDDRRLRTDVSKVLHVCQRY